MLVDAASVLASAARIRPGEGCVVCAGFGVSCPHVAATAASLTSNPAQGFYSHHITESSAGPRCPLSTLLTVASVTIMCPGVTWIMHRQQISIFY